MRQIYIVNCLQIVTSESHPEGLFSVVSGYPRSFDSRNYNATEENPNGDEERALQVAKAEYFSRLSAMYASNNRAMAVVTLERADGRQIMRESIGAFPDMTPVPVEPEEPEENDNSPEESQSLFSN